VENTVIIIIVYLPRCLLLCNIVRSAFLRSNESVFDVFVAYLPQKSHTTSTYRIRARVICSFTSATPSQPLLQRNAATMHLMYTNIQGDSSSTPFLFSSIMRSYSKSDFLNFSIYVKDIFSNS